MKATVRSPYVPENDQNQEAAPRADKLGAPGATAAGLRRVSLVPAWVRPGCAHGGARLTPGHHRGWGATPPREAPPAGRTHEKNAPRGVPCDSPNWKQLDAHAQVNAQSMGGPRSDRAGGGRGEMEGSTWCSHFYKILENVNSAAGRWLPGAGRAREGGLRGRKAPYQPGHGHSLNRGDGVTGVPMSQFTELLT